MKQKLFVTFLALGLATAASAQIHLGPRAGLNFASLSTNETGLETSNLVGIHGGLTAQYQFWKTLSVQLDALYSIQGSETSLVVQAKDGNGFDVTTRTDVTTSLNYISIPLMINWEIPIQPKTLVPYFDKEHVASFHLYGGGFFGYGLGGNSSNTQTITTDDGFNTPITTTSTSESELTTTTFNPVDFGLAFGTGFSFKLGDRSKLFVDGRYLFGFADTDKSQAIKKSNRVVQASLGYVYRVSRKKRY